MSLFASIRQLNQSMARRVPNWARLLFPIVLGGLLISLIVHILYFGGKRESLASQSESTLIRWALAFASEPASPSSARVVTISVSDEDLPTLELAPHKQLLDASITEYANVVERVAMSQPEWIVVSWLTYAHPVTQDYLKPLTDVIDRLGLHDKITLAVNLYAAGTIPPEFIRAYNIVEARDCYYDINSFCTLAPDWTWMPQQVMNRYFTRQRPWHVSTNLPHFLPNLLLNLPRPSSITRHSFLDFRPPVMADVPNNAIIFIGNDTTQNLHFRDNKDALQRTFVAATHPRRTLLKDGIPLHVFWAAMTAMFLEDKTVAIAPEWVGWIAIALLTVAIILTIRRLGSAALAPFFICALSLPLANMAGVSFFRIYMPVTPIVVAGLVIFTAATFISVAFSSYKKWRLQAAEELAESTTDIKQNFIHLISHNLNTPIAQLSGLLDIISSRVGSDTRIQSATTIIEFIRITVRAVLNTSTMANQDLQWRAHSIREFLRNFVDSESGFFRRTGIKFTITPDEDADDDAAEVWFYRFDFDRDLAHACLLFASVLVAIRAKSNAIELAPRPVNAEPADPKGLVFVISAPGSGNSDWMESPDFAVNALRRFLSMAESRGVIEVTDSGSSLTLLVRPSP